MEVLLYALLIHYGDLCRKKRPTKRAPDAGALRVRTSQAVFHALAFSQLDGFAVPALVVEPVETQRG